MPADDDPIGLFDCRRMAMIKLNMQRQNHTSCQGVLMGSSAIRSHSRLCALKSLLLQFCGFEFMSMP
jgi:hypothetical protein